ncbi:UNVERIFIED_CONTAM: atad3 [Trichonephila clavipes]
MFVFVFIATLEREMEIRNQTDMKRIEAEMRAKAKVDRENQDLYLEQIRLKAAESRVTVLESIKTAGSILGTGFNAFISDWGKVTTSRLAQHCSMNYAIMSGGDVVAMGREGVTAINKVFDWANSSRRGNKHNFISSPSLLLFVDEAEAFLRKRSSPSLEERLSKITVATRNTKKNKGMYRNLLLYGPPGTGKTLFVKIIFAFQFSAYASDDGVLTHDMIMVEVRNSIKQHEHKASWQTIEEAKKQILEASRPRAIPLDSTPS